MSAAFELTLSFAAGLVLGLMFFGGLWLTVRRLAGAPFPAGRVAASMLVRFALALGGFYLLARLGGWPHALAGALGFTVTRLVLAARILHHRNEEHEA